MELASDQVLNFAWCRAVGVGEAGDVGVESLWACVCCLLRLSQDKGECEYELVVAVQFQEKAWRPARGGCLVVLFTVSLEETALRRAAHLDKLERGVAGRP